MRAIFFLLLIPIVLSQPPIDAVESYNLAMNLTTLDGNLSEGSMPVSFGSYSGQINFSTGIDIAGMSLTIDNLTSSRKNLAVLIARGEDLNHLIPSPDSELACNSSYHPTPYCDFDGDGCPEFETNASIIYQMNVTFAFRNASSTVPSSSTIVQVPEEIRTEMSSSSGLDALNITITGNSIILYQINDQQIGQCTDSLSNFSSSVPISSNRSFQVAGTKKLFFVRSPVLGEQLSSNNHFDVIVLSQSPLYYGEFDNSQFTFKNFSIIVNSYGLEEIVSNKTSLLNFAEYGPNLTTPSLLEKQNYSFAYIYEFNSTYTAVGEHNLSLLVIDVFSGSEKHNATIMSRMLSYGGKWAENGSPISQLARPSASLSQDNLNSISISLGLVALAVFLAFVNYWIRK